jgi:starch synthase
MPKAEKNVRSVWIVTREYAGIAEAGGVKNVACSLAESLARQGVSVTAFIPRYGCVETAGMLLFSTDIAVSGETHRVCFYSIAIRGVRIILVDSPIFTEKHAVYVYTETEARVIPGAQRGKGHFDVDIVNMLFQRAVLAFASVSGNIPSVFHCQDAHTALLPALARTDDAFASAFSRTAMITTIHNAGPGYRQAIPGLERAQRVTGLPAYALQGALFAGNVEPFLLAAEYGTLTTVSPWYADELCDPAFDRFSEGLSSEFRKRGIAIVGITNGIDYHRYDPRDTGISLLPRAYDPISGDLAGKYACRRDFARWLSGSEQLPGIVKYGTIEPGLNSVYFSYHGRIAWQKGLDTLEQAARVVLDHIDGARFVILGQGDPVLESLFVRLSQRYAGRFAFINGYERTLARQAVAISDFLVLPSVFEPCGLEDFIAQIFGTIPVAHAVGGLQKIEDGKTGFLYASSGGDNDSGALARLLIDLALPIVDAGKSPIGRNDADAPRDTPSGGDTRDERDERDMTEGLDPEDPVSFGPGCAAVPRYRSIVEYAASRVRDMADWDSIVARHYLPLYEKNIADLA